MLATVIADSQTHGYRIGTHLCAPILALNGEALSRVRTVADQVKGHAQAVERAAEGDRRWQRCTRFPRFQLQHARNEACNSSVQLKWTRATLTTHQTQVKIKRVMGWLKFY